MLSGSPKPASSKNSIGLVAWCCWWPDWSYTFATRRLVVLACRNAMEFRCILRLVAEMKMPKYPRIAIFEGTSY
jgi:hypothetical protein